MDDMTEKIQSLLSDEESMQQIRELAAMFGSSSDAPSANSSAPSDSTSPAPDEALPINPAALMRLMSGLSKNDDNCNLLIALKPLLSEDKQPRVDKAVKLLRLYNIYSELKESGALGNLF